MKKSVYYKANVFKNQVWILSSTLKYLDGIALERSIDKTNSQFEFYVSPDLEVVFLSVMQIFITKKIVSNLEKII